MSTTPPWTAPLDRRAWHEAGHLLVAMCRSSVAHGVELLPGGDAKTIPSGGGPVPTNDEDWLDIIAWCMAGKLAVSWAIARGELEPAPNGVEKNHGDHGYLGGPGTDQSCAHSYAANVNSLSVDEALAEAERRALETINANEDKFRTLFIALFYGNTLTAGQVRKIVT